MKATELVIGALLQDGQLLDACRQGLVEGRYELKPLSIEPANFLIELQNCWDGLDGVLIEQGALEAGNLDSLRAQGMLLPAVVIGDVTGETTYHEAELHLPANQLAQLPYSLDAAICNFFDKRAIKTAEPNQNVKSHWRLTQRLKERLGYLGIYYKRDSKLFLCNLSEAERNELIQSLKRSYRDLLLSYFRDQASANQAIESFVNTAFFSDLPITKAVEIHMNLIDGWSKQLLLEGHQSEFLQDYRLALLDVMAHLCEMYRRSIPPEPLGRSPRQIQLQEEFS
jgi:circadian clock protein KaiA